MDKQRDILIERLEQKLVERDRTIAEMSKPSSATASSAASAVEDRITTLEGTVMELKKEVRGMLDELLYQKTVISEMQQRIESGQKSRRNVKSAEYIVAESTSEAHSGYDERDGIIIAC
ncbi:MAG TPA: hypothetical protein ENF24_05160 [Methanosarcinales archaeon]|nr:hypothetical protein [Methanosarcinales archaeon]